MQTQRIKINGELLIINNILNDGYLPMIETDSGDFYLASNTEHAGEKNREYWQDMIDNDPKEFACMVGEETLVKWGMNQWAGPGNEQVKNLEDWLALVENYPEEQWAGYDGEEKEVDRFGTIANDLGFEPTVAYRHN